MYQILCNMKGSRHIDVTEKHLETIEKYLLLNDLLDSNGIVDDSTLDKLRLNVKDLLNSDCDAELLNLCSEVLFHDNMKAFGLHQLILLYIEWQKEKLDELKGDLESEMEV